MASAAGMDGSADHVCEVMSTTHQPQARQQKSEQALLIQYLCQNNCLAYTDDLHGTLLAILPEALSRPLTPPGGPVLVAAGFRQTPLFAT